MAQKWYQKASVQVAIITGVVSIIIAASYILHDRSQLKLDNKTYISKINTLEDENQSKTAEIQRLETLLTPFKTIALEKYMGSEQEALQKLAEDLDDLRDSTQILKMKVQGRSLSLSQQNNLIAVLKKIYNKTISFKMPMGDQEAIRFATTIKEVFEKAGWKTDGFEYSIFSKYSEGLYVAIRNDSMIDDAKLIIGAFKSIGYTVKGIKDKSLNHPLYLVVRSMPTQ